MTCVARFIGAPLGCDIAFRVDDRIAVAARSRQEGGQPHKLHSRKLLNTAKQLVIELIHRRIGLCIVVQVANRKL